MAQVDQEVFTKLRSTYVRMYVREPLLWLTLIKSRKRERDFAIGTHTFACFSYRKFARFFMLVSSLRPGVANASIWSISENGQ